MTDGLTEVLAAPLRDKPSARPLIDTFSNVRRKHTDLAVALAEALEKRDECIAKLRRADDRVRDLRKALVRSSKRIDKARVEAKAPNTFHDDPL